MLALSAVCSWAQTVSPGEVEQWKRQLQEATESFEKSLEEHRRVIEKLQQQVESLERKTGSPTLAEPSDQAPAVIAGEIPPPSTPAGKDAVPSGISAQAWNPRDRMTLLEKGSSYLDLSFDGLFAAGGSTAHDIEESLQLGAHDPNQRGFTLQNLEATFSGSVDPYFTGQANIIFQIDAEGESGLEVEEAFMQSTSLPWNLQLKAGQYFTEFGRHNPQHPHTWNFVDVPLVNGRFLGADGMRNPGARLSWLAPTPFYSELFFSVQNSQGETAASFRGGIETESERAPYGFRETDNDRGVRALEDMLYGPRYVLSFDPTDEQVVLLGGSALFGPNASGGEDAGSTDTQVYGLDLTWKWKPVNHSGGFPFLTWQTEAMLRQYDAGAFDWDLNGDGVADSDEIVDPATGLPAVVAGERLTDHGFYTQLVYGFRRGWVAGVRFDYVTGDDARYEGRGFTRDGERLGRDQARSTRWRLSPNLTWYPTEYSKVRLQYNYDDRNGLGEDHSVWLQFEFVLGAHAAHTF